MQSARHSQRTRCIPNYSGGGRATMGREEISRGDRSDGIDQVRSGLIEKQRPVLIVSLVPGEKRSYPDASTLIGVLHNRNLMRIGKLSG